MQTSKMRLRILGYVAQLINKLTSDEDIRQELWVYFLEGNSPFLLEKKLSFIKEKENKADKIIMYVDMETLNGFKEKF